MRAGLHGEPELDQFRVLGAVMGGPQAGRRQHHYLVHGGQGSTVFNAGIPVPLEILGEMDYSRQMRRICPLIWFPAALLFAQAQPSFEVASVRSQPWEGNGRVGV